MRLRNWIASAVLGLLVSVAILVSCAPPNNTQQGQKNVNVSVYHYHDDQRNVTCWIYNGMSCIPDWQLEPPVGNRGN